MELEKSWKYTSVLLKIIGIWPESANANKMHTTIILVILTNAVVNCSYCSAIEWPYLPRMIFPLSQLAISMLATVKYTVLLINHSNVHWQIRVLHEVFWASVAPSTQREIILQGFANESLFNTKLTAFCVYMSGFLTICRPIVKMHLNSYREKLLIQKNWLDMLNRTDSPFYEVTFFFQIASAFIVITTQIAVNNCFLVLCPAVNAQFKLLKYQFRNLGTHEETNLPYNQSGLIIHEIKAYIEYHELLLRYAKMIEQSYSMSILMVFLLSSVFLCLSAFHFITNTSDLLDRISNTVFLLSMMLEIYLYCSKAQQLTALSSEIADGIFHSRWIYFPKNVKMLLHVVMIRCRKPAALTMGKFRGISLETFRSILSTTTSYITLLESMNNK